MAVTKQNHADLDTDVLIVGGGFGGMYAIWKFRQLGLDVKLFEAGADFGGTWHWNRYPGARVDSEAPFYGLSIPEVWKTWNWTERFPSGDELRLYFRHVDRVLDLRRDAFFNTIVVSSKYEQNHWTVVTQDGRVARCRYLLMATGSSYKKHIPDFPNLKAYKGTVIHAADYPAHFDVRGKRIGVIGNGATGVQLIQELAKEPCQLTAFIRTPIIALPMRQRRFTVDEQETSKHFYARYYDAARNSRSGFPCNPPATSFQSTPPAERLDHMETCWRRGGFAFTQGNYRDFVYDKKVNRIFYDFWAEHVRTRIKDRAKADIVAPLEPKLFFGTKRASLEQDYYESIDRDNVTLVDLFAAPLVEFTPSGVATTEGVHELDVVLMATGYDAVTGSLLDMGLSDKDGIPLREKWRNGVRTHLGMTVEGMPNLFMVYSPQAPTAFSNGPPVIEAQVDWVADAIVKMQQEGIAAIEAQPEAATRWRDDIQAMNDRTLLPLSSSWYMGSNIPGKPREQLLYMGGLNTYIEKSQEALKSWDGFTVTPAASTGNP